MARNRRSPSTTTTVGHLERSERWAGLRRGDPVEISGTGLRSASWEMVAHVRNTETGDEWVEVVGGRPGDRKIRSFRPEQVYAPRSSRGKGGGSGAGRASLADAPQLPFD
jgi:hypothetical protein